jgi:hypothetical protein
VSDEGEFWATRNLERLTKEVGEQSVMLKALARSSLLRGEAR